MSMEVNQYEKVNEGYEFAQKCTGFDSAMYLLKEGDIVSVFAEYNKAGDSFFITCELKNGLELVMMILNVSGSENKMDSEGFNETDVYEIMEFLEGVLHEENEYYCAFARITDVYGFDLKMRNPVRTYVDTSNDAEWKLHISDETNTFEVPIYDDSINFMYVKETAGVKEIMLKPYGQPFMEIKMLFFKRQ